MAKLPEGPAFDRPQGERPTTRIGVETGDLGLHDLAQGLSQAGAMIERQRGEEAQSWARGALDDWRIETDSKIAERAATYDGAEPGLARRTLEETDASFATLRARTADPIRLAALQDAYDGYRAQQGGNLSQIEAAKRAEPLRLQRQTAEDVALSTSLFALDADFRARRDGIEDPAKVLATWDEAAKAAVDAAPEALRPRLAAKAANMRLDIGLKAAEADEALGDARMAEAAGQNLDTVSNSLLSNPAGYREAAALIPTISATLPAPLRLKWEAEAKGQVAASYMQGLINRGHLDIAAQQLNGGALDGVLEPPKKQAFLNQLDVAGRVAARQAKRRAGGDDDEDGPADGTGGLTAAGGPVGNLVGKPFDNTKANAANDPIKFALGTKKSGPIAPVAPMDPNQGLSGEPAWGQALQQRHALGIELSKGYGVPQRMLTNAERAFYADAMERDPQAGVKLAANARAAIGPAGAQALMREVGLAGSAPAVTLHLADMAAASGDSFAAKASKGLSLMTQGEKVSDAERKPFDASFETLRGSLAPETLLAAKQAAVAAWLADRASGTAAEPEFYTRRALGGTSYGGARYGGQAKLNGATVLLPGWLNPLKARDALVTLGGVWAKHEAGPVFENGKPMTAADIARRSLRLTPNGWYQLYNPQTKTVAMQRNGKPFVFDLDRDRGFLGKSLGPGAVLEAR